MAEQVKGTALKTFALAGRFIAPGPAQVPAGKVDRLVKRGLFAKESAGTAVVEADADTLPEGFPHAARLKAAGVTSRAQVSAMSDAELEALPGIGKASVRDIREAK